MLGRQTADGVEHLGAGIGLAKKTSAAQGFGLSARLDVVMRGNENDRRLVSHRHVPPLQLDAGHAVELNIEDQAVELRTFLIREERFRRGVGHRLDSCRAQQPAE